MPFQKNKVPQSDHYVEVEVVRKEARKPLEARHFNFEEVCFEVGVEGRQFTSKELFDDALVYESSLHVSVVVDRHHAFDDARKGPKRLFFGHDLEQTANDEVKSLAVAQLIVANAVSRADAFNCVFNISPCGSRT